MSTTPTEPPKPAKKPTVKKTPPERKKPVKAKVRKPQPVTVATESPLNGSLQPLPASLDHDPVQEIYDYAKSVCEALRPLVKP